MKQYDSTFQASARQFAHLLELTRARYPATPWQPPWRPKDDARPLSVFTARGEANLRKIIELRRQGLDYRAIAERIGLSENTIATVAKRARQRGEWPDDLLPGRKPKAREG